MNETIIQVHIKGLPAFYLLATDISDEIKERIAQRFKLNSETFPDPNECREAFFPIILVLAGEHTVPTATGG